MASSGNKHYSRQGNNSSSGPSGSGAMSNSSNNQCQRPHGRLHHHPYQHHRRPKHAVHWFRKGLRLTDNPALRRAMNNSDTWRCIFILDPWFAGSSNQGVNKWRFLLQCLEDIDQGLRKLNSRLYVVRGQPADSLPNLFKQWNTTYLSFEEDPEPFGKIRDQNIMAMCKEMGIRVVTEKSHTLYDLNK